MKKFFINSIFLGLPLALWILLVIIIDPFNYFNFSKVIPDQIKLDNADQINTLMYRTIQFTKNPKPNIIIGDSRANLLTIEELEQVSGEKYSRLTTYAAKLEEIYDIFWYADEKVKLKNVIIGINFNMFNEFGYSNRVDNVKTIIKNPFEYIFNPNVAYVLYLTVKESIFKKKIKSEPKKSKKEFWEYMLNVRGAQWYSKYKYPENYYNELTKIDKYAKENNINLIFIITPHHRDFHDRLISFGLEKEEQKFKENLKNLSAKVIDYDYENEITLNEENFTDPIHYQKNISTIIINEIFLQEYKYGKCLSCK